MQGFKNPNRIAYKPINLASLQQLAEKAQAEAIDATTLAQHGLISKCDRYKILGNGTLSSPIQVMAHAFSASARAAIEKTGGKATVIDLHA